MPKAKSTTKKAIKKIAGKVAEKEKAAKKPAKETVAKKPVVKEVKKETVAKVVEKELTRLPQEKRAKYFEAVGRRKTSTARVRLFTQDKKDIAVNNKPHSTYFPLAFWQKVVEAPLEKLNCLGKFGVSAKVKGGGLSGQAEAVRMGIARALVLLNPYFKKRLRKAGFLTRDPRIRERKKPGLKRARRAPQWSKR